MSSPPVTPRTCALVPTFDNPRTVGAVVERIRGYGLAVVLVDDGSGAEGRAACDAAAVAEGPERVELVRFERNRGKGAAVQAGFRRAHELGYTHAFQIDADGQHDLERIPAFLAASAQQPTALVIGYPLYDDSAPSVRRRGRLVTAFWVALEVGSRRTIADAMVGFRVYPLAPTLALGSVGPGMEFDIEVAVRLVRAGVPTVNLPVGVRYPPAEEGGVSHFRMVRDNLRFGLLHARLCTAGALRWLGRGLVGAGSLER